MAGKGDVVYEIRADDSKIESDLEQANRKVQKAVKGIKDESINIDVNADVSDAKQGLKAIGEAAEDVGENLDDVFEGTEESASFLGNLGGVLKDSFTGAADSAIPLVGNIGQLTAGLSAAQVAAVGAGAAAAGIGVLAVGAANDMAGAMNSFLAETGKAKAETELYQGVLENIYANNYGESFEDIASAMASVTKTLGDMDDASLQEITESAFALRDTFEYDIQESTRAAKAMMDNLGVSGQDAMSMIAAGAQNGLDYSGELLDSISEYSVQFGKMGLSADDMFNIFQKGAESGAFNLDKVGDAVKEMSIRVIDGSDTTKEGFELLGLNADEMAKKFAKGGDSAKAAFDETLDALASMEDPIAQNTAGVAIMGTMWEDLGPDAVAALSGIEDGAYDTADAMNQIKDVKYDDLNSMFEALTRNVELLLIPIGEALIPILEVLISSVLPIVNELLKPLVETFGELVTPVAEVVSSALEPMIDAFMALINEAIQPLLPVLNVMKSVFEAVLGGMGKSATTIIGSITDVLRSLMSFIKNVFTGNWRGAWEDIRDIVGSAFEGLVTVFKSPINKIIDGWNALARDLGSIKIPDWVPIVGGNTWKLPKVSRLKIGMDYVPYDLFPAYLDEGEMVLTKEEANLLRSLGGLEGMTAMLGQTGSDNVNVTVRGGANIDYDLLGTSIVNAFVRAGVGFKCDDRVFATLIKDLIDYV